MLKKTFAAVMASCVLALALSGTGWALDLSGPARPLLALNGATRPDLSVDIISLVCDSAPNRMEVTLNNWDPATVSYKHSDSHLFLPGTRITVFMGPSNQQVKVFEGTIASLAPHFMDASPSTVTVIATGVSRITQSNVIPLPYGGGLRQFDPVLNASGTVTCTGVAQGNPEIQVGTSLSITHVGPRFSQTFQVTQVVHAFDGIQGYITRFTASTRPEAVPSVDFKRRLSSALSKDQKSVQGF